VLGRLRTHVAYMSHEKVYRRGHESRQEQVHLIKANSDFRLGSYRVCMRLKSKPLCPKSPEWWTALQGEASPALAGHEKAWVSLSRPAGHTGQNSTAAD